MFDKFVKYFYSSRTTNKGVKMVIEVVDKINGSKFDLSNVPFVYDIESAKTFLIESSPFFNSEDDFQRYEFNIIGVK
jgi:hypothetical protein